MNQRRLSLGRSIAAIAAMGAAMPALALIPGASGNGLPCGGSVVVESGDTLGEIASYCGVSVDAIIAMNPTISGPDSIATGQSLVIPAAVPVAATPAAELEDLLAPIALYPDALLAEMLTAATYPLELVQADRWVKTSGPDADPAAQNWAPSVAALTQYPDVLAMMSNDLDWSIQLGDAFLAEPDRVFASIQTLRGRAQEAGNLIDNDKQRIIVEPVQSLGDNGAADTTVVEVVEPVVTERTIIRIVPRHDTLFVPVYHPRWAYFPRSYYSGFYHDPVFAFGAGYAWGSFNHFVDWRFGFVRLTPFGFRSSRFFYGNRFYRGFNVRGWQPWIHHPVHRRGFRYSNVPRVRINEGQRHLVNVAPRARGAVGRNGVRRGNADYRAGERRASLARNNSRSAAANGNVRRGGRADSAAISRRLSTARGVNSRRDTSANGVNNRQVRSNDARRNARAGTREANSPQAQRNNDARARRLAAADTRPASRANSRTTTRQRAPAANARGESANVNRRASANRAQRDRAANASRSRLEQRLDANPNSRFSNRAARRSDNTVVRSRSDNRAQASGPTVRQRATTTVRNRATTRRQSERSTVQPRASSRSQFSGRDVQRRTAPAASSRPARQQRTAPARASQPRVSQPRAERSRASSQSSSRSSTRSSSRGSRSSGGRDRRRR